MAVLETDDKSILNTLKKYKSILITMVVVVVISGVTSSILDSSAGPSGNAAWYTVLPETAHSLSSADAVTREPEMIKGPMTLTGTIIDPNGNNIAIIEADNNSYLTRLGSPVGNMKVVEISGSTVTLAGDQGAQQLQLSGSSKPSDTENAVGLSINFRKTVFANAASALAMASGYTVLVSDADASGRVDYQNNTESFQSLESIAKNQGLIASRKGNLVVISKADALGPDFFNQVIKFKFNLKYLNGKDLNDLIVTNKDDLGVSPDFDPNIPHQFRFVGQAQSVEKVREIVALCDVPDMGSLQSKTLTVKNIAPDKGVEMLAKAGIPLTKYVALGNTILVFDPAYFKKWNEVEALLSKFDVPSASGATIVLMRLKYITADEASTALAQFNIGGGSVSTIDIGNAQFSKDIMIVCPSEYESQVKAALNTIDTSRAEVKLPVVTATGKGAVDICKNKRKEISSQTGIPEDKMYISSDAGGSSTDSRLCVLWIKETPEKIKQVQDMIGQI